MKIFNSSSFKEMPWKNGGGSTKELFKIPSRENPDQFYFRISIATIHQDGPFSKFPGIDRFLMLLEGKGFVLNKSIRFEKTLDQFNFRGEEEIQCDLIDGSSVDFNVMTERDWGKSEVIVSTMMPGEKLTFKCSYLYLHSEEPQLIVMEKGESYTYEAQSKTFAVNIDVILTN